jgi:ankyrin repeat protein
MLLITFSPIIGFGEGYRVVARPNTELSKAAYYGHFDQARQLIDTGSDVNEQSNVAPGYKDFTALMWAVIGNNEEIIQYLVESGADINATAEEGTTALHLSIISSLSPGDSVIEIPRRVLNASTVKLLLSLGADVNAGDEYGVTVLSWAVWNVRGEIVQVLLEAGADVNNKGKRGRTALMTAAAIGKIEAVKILLDAGSDVNAITNDGKSALMYAKEKGHTAIVDLLREGGAYE